MRGAEEEEGGGTAACAGGEGGHGKAGVEVSGGVGVCVCGL